MTYTIEKITTLIGARLYGGCNAAIGWLLTDSRSLCFPEQTLFFALRTKHGDGHRYIGELYRRGVRAFVVEQVPADFPSDYPQAAFLRVPSVLAALQRLAERHRDEFEIPVVGITGSNGKTWVKEWLYQLLRSSDIPVTRSPRSYNSQIGVPLSVWLLNEQTRVALFEAGISEPGEMLPLSDIIQPTIGVFTSLGTAHQERFFASVEQFVQSPVFSALRDAVVLIKGARSFGFERISELLEQKVHETILEVDLNAVVANLNHYRSLLRPETKLVCMIKADAYGAGAVEIARTLQEHRMDYLAVAVADEGVELRKAGITQNIIVMNPEMSSFKTLFDYDLEPEVYSFRLMDALIRAARSQGITGWPVHVKLDTGMHRLGFDVGDLGIEDSDNNKSQISNHKSQISNHKSQINELIDALTHQQAIIPRSVFSHFVGSDSADFDDFSARQFRLFDEASRRLQAAFSHKILRHIDNSAGIEHFPERQLDMCRLGIGLYTNVSTLSTTILQLRHVPKEETVGYSRRGTLTRDSVIAAIPIGYADGLDRRLGNRHGYCMVNGQRAEYVGNICMDVALVDVTGIDCREGDRVEIFGRTLPVDVLADTLGTITYEVLTSVSNRVKRVYFQED